MRLKIASILLLAGTVVGCANNPPPPPPMAAMPEPAPAPAPMTPMAPMAGSYRGMAELASGGRTCHAPRGMQTARVRGTDIMLAGMRGKIGPDGMITGRGLSGTVSGSNADVTVKRGSCSYHYTLSNGSGATSMPDSTGINGNTGSGMEGGPGMSGGSSSMNRGM